MSVRPRFSSIRTATLAASKFMAIITIAVLANNAARADRTLTFDSLAPGTSFTSVIDGEYELRSYGGVDVHPGASSCEAVPCISTETSSLAIPPGGNGWGLVIRRVDGGAFEPSTVDIGHESHSGSCAYRYHLDRSGPTDKFYFSCRKDGLQTLQFERLPVGSPSIVEIVFFNRLSPSPIQIDNLFIRETPPPPDPGLYTLTDDRRSISAVGAPPIFDASYNVVGCESIRSDSRSPLAPFADFSRGVGVSLGHGDQESEFNPSGFLALGSATGWSDYCWGEGRSIFEVDFDLAGPANVRLIGSIEAGSYSWGSEAELLLARDGEEVLAHMSEGSGSRTYPVPFELDEVLSAGHYTLTLRAEADLGSAEYAAEMWVSNAPPLDVEVDVEPWSAVNHVNPMSHGLVTVALLGSDVFDVDDVDMSTLSFGPAEASPAFDLSHPGLSRLARRDVNRDGFPDLVSYYRRDETGIAVGDVEACLIGATYEERELVGCDTIVTSPRCGPGYEFTAVLLPWAWLRRRRGRSIAH